MALPSVTLWFDSLGGVNTQHTDRLRQDRELLEFAQANNVIPDPAGELVTAPGFGKIRATAITSTPVITYLGWMGKTSDTLIIGTGNAKIYKDTANPPAEVTGGTAQTSGDNVLLRGYVANNEALILVSNARDVPQYINASLTRSDLAGTPPRGIDYVWWGRRGFMFAPSYGGSTYADRVMFNSANDDVDAWTNPDTTNFLNFGAPVLGGIPYKSHLLAFSEDNCWPIYTTPNSDLPFAFLDSIISEPGGGPCSIHGVVAGEEKVYWISRNFDVKCLLPNMQVKSIGYPIQPFLRGLSASRLQYISGGWEPKYRMVIWNVSDGSDTQHKDQIALQVDTGQFFLLTRSRNALCNRVVSGQMRLVGGGYSGFIYNEFSSDTTGDLDDSTALIDADIITPRMHLGMPGVVKKIPYVEVVFDPISTEVVTVQYRLDDESSWTSFAESTVTLSGTDVFNKKFKIPRPFERIQLRFRDAVSGDRFRITKFGFPSPQNISTEKT